MSGYSVNWEECEPSLDNVWSNLDKIDNYYRLDVATLIIMSYYKLHLLVLNTFSRSYVILSLK